MRLEEYKLDIIGVNELFNYISIDHLKDLAKEAELISFSANEVLYDPIDNKNDLFIICSGDIQNTNDKPTISANFYRNIIGNGGIFSNNNDFVQKIFAKSDLTCIKISKNNFDSWEFYNQYIEIILRNFASIRVNQTIDINKEVKDRFIKENKDLEYVDEYSKAVVGFSLVLLLNFYTREFLKYYLYLKPDSNLFTGEITMLVLLIPIFKYINLTKYNFKELGITLENWDYNLMLGIVSSLFLYILFYFGMDYFKNNTNLISDKDTYFHRFTLTILIIYFLFSIVQEICTLSFTLRLSYDYTKSYFIAIPLTCYVFSIIHLPLGVFMSVTSLFLALVNCIIFIRTRSLVAPIIIHYAAGIVATAYGFMGTSNFHVAM